MPEGSQGEEDQGEHHEDEGLDKAYKKLQPIKGKGDQIRDEECYHTEEHFAGEDVAEKSEGEGDDLGQFADQFQNADEEIDDTVKNAPAEINMNEL